MLSIKVARTLSTDALINRHRMTAVCAKSSARVIQETNSLYKNTEFQLLKKNLKKTAMVGQHKYFVVHCMQY